MAPSRRRALTLGLGMGYAAATLPVMAQTAIKTPADGLSVGEVSIDVAGFKMPAFRAQPAGKTGLPVVLVLSEIFGVHEYIADTAVRLARAGYLAIAPELFVRQGDAQSYGELAKLMSEVIAKVPDAQVHGRPGRRRGLGGGQRWRYRQAGRDRVLLGRQADLAVCGPPAEGQGRRGVVRAPGG
ncbi:hypothetical protein MASR1M50_29770 [Burkholderiales bacterium]